MTYKLLAAIAALAFTSAPALAATCYDQTAAAIKVAGSAKNVDMAPTFVRSQLESNGPEAAMKFASYLNVPAVCRPHSAANIKAYAGLGQPSEPASQPAATSSPVNSTQTTTSAPAGGGAMLDAKIAELEARLASANTPAEVQAAQAALAAAVNRAEAAAEAAKRASADAAKQMNRVSSRPGVSPQAINAAAANLQAAQKQLGNANEQLDAIRTLAGQAKSSAASAANSAGIAATAQAETATLRQGAAASATRAKSEADLSKSAADRAETAAKNAEASGGFDLLDWVLWVVIPILVIGLIFYWHTRTGLATETAVDLKADITTTDALATRIDGLDARLTDTEDQVGKKVIAIAADVAVKLARAKEGDLLTTAVVADNKIFEVQLRKGAGSDVFIVSGLDKSHDVKNAVTVLNLNRVLRKAAYDGRLVVEAIT